MNWFTRAIKKRSKMDRIDDQHAINTKKFSLAVAQYQKDHANDPRSCKTCDYSQHIVCKHCSINPNAHLEDNWEPKIPQEIWNILLESIKEIEEAKD